MTGESLRQAPPSLQRPVKLEKEAGRADAFAPIPTQAPVNRGLSAAQALVDLVGVSAEATDNLLKDKIAEDVTRQRQRALTGMEPQQDATKSGQLAYNTVNMRNDFAVMQRELATDSSAQEWSDEAWDDHVISKQSSLLQIYDSPGDTRMAEMLTNMMGEALPSIQVRRWDDKQSQDIANKKATTVHSLDLAASTAKDTAELKGYLASSREEARAMGLDDGFFDSALSDAAINRAEQDDLSLMEALPPEAFDHNPALSKAKRSAEGRINAKEAVQVSGQKQGLLDQFTGYGGLDRLSEDEFRQHAQRSNEANPPGIWTASQINSEIQKRRKDDNKANKSGKGKIDVNAMVSQGLGRYSDLESERPLSEYREVDEDGTVRRPTQADFDQAIASVEQGFLQQRLTEAGVDVNDPESMQDADINSIIKQVDLDVAEYMSIHNITSTEWENKFSSLAEVNAEHYGEDGLPQNIQFDVERYSALPDHAKIRLVPDATNRSILDNYAYFKDRGNTSSDSMRKAQKVKLFNDPQNGKARERILNEVDKEVRDDLDRGFFRSLWKDGLDNEAAMDTLISQVQGKVIADKAAGNKASTATLTKQHIADFRANNTPMKDGTWINASQSTINDALGVYDSGEANAILQRVKPMLVDDLIVEGTLPDNIGTTEEITYQYNSLTGGFNIVGLDGSLVLEDSIDMEIIKGLYLDWEKKEEARKAATITEFVESRQGQFR